METLVSVMKKVEDAGYVSQFRVTEENLHSLTSGKIYGHETIKVDHFYRFEGQSSQDDEAILYAIAAESGEKGTLVDAFGASGDADITEFMRKVDGIHK